MRNTPAMRAFTLIEIVTVITLMGIVLSGTTVMLTSVNTSAKVVRREGHVQEQARRAIDAIATAARNMVRQKQRDWQLKGVDDEWAMGDKDAVKFFTVSHRQTRERGAESDVKEVAFMLMEPDDARASGLTPGNQDDDAVLRLGTLMRRTDPTRNEEPDEGGVEEVIATGITRLEVQYYDGLEWVHEWEEERSAFLPKLMRVSIEARDASGKGHAVRLSRLIRLPWMPADDQKKGGTSGIESGTGMPDESMRGGMGGERR